MYIDKLDGRIDADFFDRKAVAWRAEQARLRSDMDTHCAANQNYIQEGIKLLELAQRAARLFELDYCFYSMVGLGSATR